MVKAEDFLTHVGGIQYIETIEVCQEFCSDRVNKCTFSTESNMYHTYCHLVVY